MASQSHFVQEATNDGSRNGLGEGCSAGSRKSWSEPTPRRLVDVFRADAQRLQELDILGIQAEFRVAVLFAFYECWPAYRSLIFTAVKSNGRLKDQKNVVTTLLNLGDHVADLLTFAERFVDGVAKFLHQLFEPWVQIS